MSGFADAAVTTRSDTVIASPTVTSNRCTAERLEGSRAVTLMVAVPSATAVTASVEPDNATVAVACLDELAVKLRLSPSGSVKDEDTSIESVSPVSREGSPILPTARGGRFPSTTCNSKLPVTESSAGSLTVAVTVTVPGRMPVRVSVAPDTLTVAIDWSDDPALYVRSSPSGSLKYGER